MNERDLTAEAMPAVRKAAKGLGLAAFLILWISAMAMTLAVMLDRTHGEPWYVALGLVALGIGADFWVGAGPVILRSAKRWGIGAWSWIGLVSLIMALVFSYTNKVGYWVERSQAREVRVVSSTIDPLTDERALVAQYPDARVPEAVRAEISGVQGLLEAKNAEIASMPPEWKLRERRALREKGEIQVRLATLESEAIIAERVAEARRKIAAQRESAVLAPITERQKIDPLAQWIIDLGAAFGVTITPSDALVWLHALYALFHEVGQLVFLGLATLRVPQSEAEKEQAYAIAARRRKVEKKVAIAQVKAREAIELAAAEATLKAKRQTAVTLADARAKIEAEKEEREIAVVARRAGLEHEKALREVERERREFEAQCAYEDGRWEEAKPLPAERGLPNYTSEAPIVQEPLDANKEVYAQFVDAVRSEAAKKGWDTRRAKARVEKTDGGTEFEAAPELSDSDPRKVPEAVRAEPWMYDVVTDIARRVMYGRPRNAAPEPEQVAPVVEAETQDLIAPPLSQEQAQELVAAGTHEFVTDDNGDRWLRQIEREAQQGAGEIVLADNGGVMKREGAD